MTAEPESLPTLAALFADDSPLARHLEGFRPRPGQAWMAEAVAEAIAARRHLIVEAGTGTGKTFAYLLPALLSGARTIISTGTRALQDQLYHRDLPLVGKVVGRPVTTALLKGRANYLCLQRLEQAQTDEPGLARDLDEVRQWRHRTRRGDRAELTEVAEDSRIWPLVTSTADNCLGQDCPLYRDCHVVRARREAQQADLVVVNHHLLLADLAMKESGFVEFLPGADAVILDEAHQVPELAAQFFGLSIGSRELERLHDEVEAATLSVRDKHLAGAIEGARTAVRALRAEAPRKPGRYEFAQLVDALHAPLGTLRERIDDLHAACDVLGGSSLEIDKLAEQLLAVSGRLAHFVSEDSWEGLRWVEVRSRSLRLHLTPLDVSDTMRNLLHAGEQAWILTSATLAVGDDFGHFAGRIGLGDAQALRFQSPYALADRGLVYAPQDMPAPSDRDYTAAVMRAVAPLAGMTRGGVFCLFTSHRALGLAADWCEAHPRVFTGRELLVQGRLPRDQLLKRFRESGNAVLLGTGTFWEGVDVRGEALTVVAIDKLPFASPSDPLTMARIEHVRRAGGNPFVEHQLPQAALALKQGAGRLLRDDSDYGVVVLCDPRVFQKSYGRLFLDCLAPMPVTRDAEDVAAFFARHEAMAESAR